MADRRRVGSTTFWVGVIAAVLGLALVVAMSGRPDTSNPFGNLWFDVGLGLIVVGAVVVVWDIRARPS